MKNLDLLKQLSVQIAIRMHKNVSDEAKCKTGLFNAKAVEDAHILSLIDSFCKRADVGTIGVKDKNGRYICEGDTICIHNVTFGLKYTGKVVYEPERARFCVEVKKAFGVTRYDFCEAKEESYGSGVILAYYEYEIVPR